MYQEYLNQLHSSIATLSSEELKDLLNDEEKLDGKVDEVLEILKVQKENLLKDNRSKAENNIAKEPEIIELRGKVNEFLAEGKTCCESVQEKLITLKEKSGSVSQETALALLQTAAAESEEETEGIVKKFTENEINAEAFIESFLAARKKMHLRKLKAEKMQELIRKQAQRSNVGTGGGGSGIPAYSNFYPPAPGTGVPYPMGPMMPMPPRPY